MPFEAEHALSRTKGTPEMKKQKKESKHQSSGPGSVEDVTLCAPPESAEYRRTAAPWELRQMYYWRDEQ